MEKIQFKVNPVMMLRVYTETCISNRIVNNACVEDRAALTILNKLKDSDITQLLINWHNATERTVIDIPDMIMLEEEIERLIFAHDKYEKTVLKYAKAAFGAFTYSRYEHRIMSHGIASHYEGALAAAENFFGVPEIYDYSKADIRGWIVENVICNNATLSTVAYATQIANDIGR